MLRFDISNLLVICYNCPCHKGFTHVDCQTIRPTSPQTTFPQWHYHNCIAQRWRSLIVIVICLQRCLFVSRVQDEQLVTEVFPDDKHKSWYHDISGKQLRLRSETVKDCTQIICKIEGEALLQVPSTCSEGKLVLEQPRDVKRVNRQDLLLKCSVCEVETPKTHINVIILYP